MELLLSQKNLDRVAALATQEGRLIPGMVNEIITRYFEEKRESMSNEEPMSTLGILLEYRRQAAAAGQKAQDA